MTITREDLSSFNAERVFHCSLCLDERPDGVAPRDWSRLSFGMYEKPDDPGIYLQLWCDRHAANVTTIYIESSGWYHVDQAPIRIRGAA